MLNIVDEAAIICEIFFLKWKPKKSNVLTHLNNNKNFFFIYIFVGSVKLMAGQVQMWTSNPAAKNFYGWALSE